MPPIPSHPTREHERLNTPSKGLVHPWQKWGPYVSERAWGTVREDYSPDGNAWDYLPHELARSKAYRLLLAHQVDAATAQRLDVELKRVAELMSKLNPNRDSVAGSAASSAALADNLVQRVLSCAYDRAVTAQLLQRICAEADDIAKQGEGAATQATMAVESLFAAYSADTRGAKMGNAAAVRAAINELFPLVENPSTYEPARFAQQLC